MSHFAIDIPEWEQEARLQYEADPIMDAAFEAAASMTHEQRLALLDSLGIDYSAYVEDETPTQPPAEPAPSKFDLIFG
jgi:hypothetical protein